MKNKGYHSRSPEELKDFLESMNKSSRKRNWKNLIILFDISLVLLIFFVMNRTLNPEWNVKISNKIVSENLEMYLTRMVESDPQTVTYFFMCTNTSSQSIVFPSENDRFSFTFSTKNGLDCIKKQTLFTPETLVAGKTGYFSIEIKKDEFDPLPPDCKALLRNKEKKKFINVFSNRSLGTVTLERENPSFPTKQLFTIEKELW